MMPRKSRLNAQLKKYVKAKRLKAIPALALTGGALKHLEDAKEFRVWAYPKGGGDDYYESHPSLEHALGARVAMSKRGDVPEMPLAVVWDKKHRSWREVAIPKSMIRGATDRAVRVLL